MPICAGYNCHKRIQKGTSLFKFPKNPDVCESWLRCLNREDLYDFTYDDLKNGGFRVCQKHFDTSDIYKKGSKTFLKKGALPTVHIVPNTNPCTLETPFAYLEEGVPQPYPKVGVRKVVDIPARASLQQEKLRERRATAAPVDDSPLGDVEIIQYCSVPMCSNNSKQQPHIEFHPIPERRVQVSGSNRITLNEIWMKFLNTIMSLWGMKTNMIKHQWSMRICSIHFKDEDFIMMPVKDGKQLRILRNNAFPSVDPLFESYLSAQRKLLVERPKHPNRTDALMKKKARPPPPIKVPSSSTSAATSRQSTISAAGIGSLVNLEKLKSNPNPNAILKTLVNQMSNANGMKLPISVSSQKPGQASFYLLPVVAGKNSAEKMLLIPTAENAKDQSAANRTFVTVPLDPVGPQKKLSPILPAQPVPTPQGATKIDPSLPKKPARVLKIKPNSGAVVIKPLLKPGAGQNPLYIIKKAQNTVPAPAEQNSPANQPIFIGKPQKILKASGKPSKPSDPSKEQPYPFKLPSYVTTDVKPVIIDPSTNNSQIASVAEIAENISKQDEPVTPGGFPVAAVTSSPVTSAPVTSSVSVKKETPDSDSFASVMSVSQTGGVKFRLGSQSGGSGFVKLNELVNKRRLQNVKLNVRETPAASKDLIPTSPESPMQQKPQEKQQKLQNILRKKRPSADNSGFSMQGITKLSDAEILSYFFDGQDAKRPKTDGCDDASSSACIEQSPEPSDTIIIKEEQDEIECSTSIAYEPPSVIETQHNIGEQFEPAPRPFVELYSDKNSLEPIEVEQLPEPTSTVNLSDQISSSFSEQEEVELDVVGEAPEDLEFDLTCKESISYDSESVDGDSPTTQSSKVASIFDYFSDTKSPASANVVHQDLNTQHRKKAKRRNHPQNSQERRHTSAGFGCPNCLVRFPTAGLASAHVFRHWKVLPYKCVCCGKRHHSAKRLKAHRCGLLLTLLTQKCRENDG